LVERNAYLFLSSEGLYFHNSYLSTLVENGVVGLMAFFVVVGRSLWLAGGRLLAIAGKATISAAWTGHVLPLALVVGALAHAFFESWLLNGGNANTLVVWTLIWLLALPSDGPHFRGSTKASLEHVSR
jgi:O-antigen ligase